MREQSNFLFPLESFVVACNIFASVCCEEAQENRKCSFTVKYNPLKLNSFHLLSLDLIFISFLLFRHRSFEQKVYLVDVVLFVVVILVIVSECQTVEVVSLLRV